MSNTLTEAIIGALSPSPVGRILAVLSERGKKGSIPEALEVQVLELEDWAVANKRDARWDTISFWALKIPAMAASVGAGVFAYLEWEIVPLVVGAIASLCILVDGLNPRGKLRNVHWQAVHDLRNLQHDMLTNWQTGSLRIEDTVNKKAEEDNLAADIIEGAQAERKRIATYLKDAEALLEVKHNQEG
jgi:hypothetical protein